KIAREGDTLPTGAILGIIAAPDVPEPDIDAFIAGFTPDATAITPADGTGIARTDSKPERTGGVVSPPPGGANQSIPDELKAGPDDRDVPASPHARRLARKLGVNLHAIQSGMHGGRIQVEDIEQAILRHNEMSRPAQPDNAMT